MGSRALATASCMHCWIELTPIGPAVAASVVRAATSALPQRAQIQRLRVRGEAPQLEQFRKADQRVGIGGKHGLGRAARMGGFR